MDDTMQHSYKSSKELICLLSRHYLTLFMNGENVICTYDITIIWIKD